jgi:hypothetical protein
MVQVEQNHPLHILILIQLGFLLLEAGVEADMERRPHKRGNLVGLEEGQDIVQRVFSMNALELLVIKMLSLELQVCHQRLVDWPMTLARMYRAIVEALEPNCSF